jgi:hypothetical protein
VASLNRGDRIAPVAGLSVRCYLAYCNLKVRKER